MIELVYRFDGKSYRECLKCELIAKVRFNNVLDHKHTHIYTDTNTDHFTPLALRVQGNKESWNLTVPWLNGLDN